MGDFINGDGVLNGIDKISMVCVVWLLLFVVIRVLIIVDFVVVKRLLVVVKKVWVVKYLFLGS